MIAILSPAKRLDFATPPTVPAWSTPALLDETGKLIKTTRNLSQKKLRELMDISPALAKLNSDRYQALSVDLSPDNAKAAILSFTGDVYTGFDATTVDAAGMAWAQDRVAILSGMYGLLRPLDLIQPHRLEMGTRLKTRRGQSLYDFWGDRILKLLRQRLAASGSNVLINLASAEYFKSVRAKKLKGVRVITPKFLDTKEGKTRSVFLFAKQARGMMTRYMVDHRIDTPEGLQAFDTKGYRFRPDLSEGDTWAFERPQPPPPGK